MTDTLSPSIPTDARPSIMSRSLAVRFLSIVASSVTLPCALATMNLRPP